MADINVCTFTGRLVKDAEVKETANGSKFMTFTLAVSTYAGKDKEEETSFFDFTSGATGAAKYLTKGGAITVTATAKQRKYTDKDGNNRTTISFNAKEFTLPAKAKSDEPAEPVMYDEDIPF